MKSVDTTPYILNTLVPDTAYRKSPWYQLGCLSDMMTFIQKTMLVWQYSALPTLVGKGVLMWWKF